jgi:phosphatidylglycerol:prolipoprotein diacylglycerol transferase
VILGGRLGYAAFYTGGASGIPSAFTSFSGDGFITWQLLAGVGRGDELSRRAAGRARRDRLCHSWREKLSFLRVCDYIAVNVPMGMMLGRLANFNNGELWGRELPMCPWGMVFPGWRRGGAPPEPACTRRGWKVWRC